MRRKRRTEAGVEIEREVVVRRPSPRVVVQAFCEGCARPVTMVTAEEAAAIAGVTRRAIYRWVEAHTVHFAEMPDGGLLICLKSLTEVTSDPPRRNE